jgi:hypothetical protein
MMGNIVHVAKLGETQLWIKSGLIYETAVFGRNVHVGCRFTFVGSGEF